jgi:hypothetical protein
MKLGVWNQKVTNKEKEEQSTNEPVSNSEKFEIHEYES